MSQQLHCLDVHKISLWSVQYILNQSTSNFGLISNFIEISGAWSCIYPGPKLGHHNVPADVLVPDVAKPSAGTVMITKLV